MNLTLLIACIPDGWDLLPPWLSLWGLYWAEQGKALALERRTR